MRLNKNVTTSHFLIAWILTFGHFWNILGSESYFSLVRHILYEGDDNMLKLSSGADKLSTGAGTLYMGLGALHDNIPTLTDGIGQLKSGSKELNDGMNRFNTEGVSKIGDVVNSALPDITERFKADRYAAKDYGTFSGKSDETDGSVKFIYVFDGTDQ